MSPHSRATPCSSVRRKWSTDQVSVETVCLCVCVCVWVSVCACLSSSTVSSLCVYFLSLQSGAPAARPLLINQMPCWGSSVLGFTSVEPWVITEHHRPGARANPLHHRRVNRPSSSVRSHLWDKIALTVGIKMNGYLMGLNAERH